MASSSSPSPLPRFPVFPPSFAAIPEHGTEEADAAAAKWRPVRDEERGGDSPAGVGGGFQLRTTPFRRSVTPSSSVGSSRATPAKSGISGRENGHVVSFAKCRPSAREKISVVPLDNTSGHSRSRSSSAFFTSPRNSGVIGTFLSSLSWRSPHLSTCSSASATAPPSKEEDWRLVAADLSHKLLTANRKRDEAVSEASRLKHSMSELEKKLTRLENYCHDLKSALDMSKHPGRAAVLPSSGSEKMEFPLDSFLRGVCEARAAVRHLSGCLLTQIQQAGMAQKPLQAHDISPPVAGKNSVNGGGGLLVSLEALLCRAFFEDFETASFQRGGLDGVLEPSKRVEANLASYAALKKLSWDDVLSRGTRHYSEAFSHFCDRKMSEVASNVLGGGAGISGGLWGRRGWPEPLLQAFFGAAKGVWLVHLLAWCDHPPVLIFRVDAGTPFDAAYMEDAAAGDRARRQATSSAVVKMMVAPGFFAGSSVVKCRVICRRHAGGNTIVDRGPSPRHFHREEDLRREQAQRT